MKIITALEENNENGSLHMFLAGGITNCADWQSELAGLLNDTNLILHNPRRADFSIDDPNASAEQIEWEFRHLKQCDFISFWFAPETLNPIVLYELGVWANSVKPIVVGVHPDYQRKADVEIQMRLIRPGLKIQYDLKGLAAEIKSIWNVNTMIFPAGSHARLAGVTDKNTSEAITSTPPAAETTQLNRNEVFVIKAVKGHFGHSSGYRDAEKIIQHLVYANGNHRVDPFYMIQFLRAILIKLGNYSVDRWEELTLQMMYEAASAGWWNHAEYIERLLQVHFGRINQLQVLSGGQRLIDLDITPEEQTEIETVLGERRSKL